MGSAVMFTARGHPNILATHHRTFEFTKDAACTPRGDCIVGVAADFTLEQLKPLLNAERVRFDISCSGIREVVHAVPNPEFSHPSELVVRIGAFTSDRTFAVRADKSAADFSPEFRAALHNPATRIEMTITPE